MGDEQRDRTSGESGDSTDHPDHPDHPEQGSPGDDVDDDGRGDGDRMADEVEYPDDGTPHTALPRRVESWRRRSATGAMMTGFAFGLREILEPERHGPAVVLETSGLPPKDLPVEADLENLPPRQSVVKIRRWLLAERADPDEVGAGTTGPAPGPVPGRAGAAAGDEAADGPRTPDGAGDEAPAGPRRATEIRGRKRRPTRFGRSKGSRS